MNAADKRGCCGSLAGICLLAVVFYFPGAVRAQSPTSPGIDQAAAAARQTSSKTVEPAAPFTPLTGKEKFRRYLNSYTSPVGITGVFVGAGIGQANDSAPEWGQGARGYARRVGSNYAKHAIRDSIRFGLDGLVGYDPRFFPSERSGVWARTADALVQTLRCRDDGGRWRFAYPNLAAAFGAGLISRAWYPQMDRTLASGLRSGAISVAVDAGMNVLKEFVRRRR